MAFPTQEEEEQKKAMEVLGPKGVPGAPGVPAPPGTAPGAIPITTGAATVATDAPSIATRAGAGESGQFTNLQQYLQANIPATERLAKRVKERFTSRAEQLGKGLELTKKGLLGLEMPYQALI